MNQTDASSSSAPQDKFFVEPEVVSKIQSAVPNGATLYPFQYSGVRFLATRTRALIASDPGTGKTVMLSVAANCVRVLKDALDETTSTTLLVLCPKSMVLTWKRELNKWLVPGIDATVVNWDKLALAKHAAKYLKQWDIVIADESHTAIKNPGAIRAKAFVEKLVPLCGRVWLATATPASRSGLDYYMTLKVLIPSAMEKWNVWRFQKEFCNEVRNSFSPTGKSFEGFRNQAKLREVFSKISIRHKKEEVLPDLPELTHTNIEVEVDESIVAEHLDIDVDHVISCIERGEPLPGHIAHVMQATAQAKIDTLLEIIENFPDDEPLVIFGWHRAIVNEIVERLRAKEVSVGMITGEVTSAEARQKIVDDFQAKRLKRIVLNMQSGGVGLTLTAASTAMYIEFPRSPIHWIQSMNRIHRIGSSGNKVNIIRLVGKGTIDEAIFNALQYRMNAIKEVGV